MGREPVTGRSQVQFQDKYPRSQFFPLFITLFINGNKLSNVNKNQRNLDKNKINISFTESIDVFTQSVIKQLINRTNNTHNIKAIKFSYSVVQFEIILPGIIACGAITELQPAQFAFFIALPAIKLLHNYQYFTDFKMAQVALCTGCDY